MPRHDTTPPPTYPDHANLMVWIDDEGRERPVETVEDWRHRRTHILASMQLVMGEHPCAAKMVPLEPEVTDEVRGDGWTRRKLTFVAEEGDRVPAYLFIPDAAREPGPAMLCLHQTTEIGKSQPAGLGDKPNLHYARELAERGFVTLAPDYPGYGDYHIDAYAMGYVAATMKGIWNHERAVDLLASLDEVDSSRIGCIGHSLGGHNSLYVAAFDERLRVAVTSCGFNSFFKYMGGDLTGWSHRGYMPRIAERYGCDPAQMPFDFTEILGTIAPRAVFVNAPTADGNFELSGVTDCLDSARPVYGLYAATDRLVAAHPECGHDFPPEVRERAYAFIASALA